MPSFIQQPILLATTYLTVNLGFDLPALGARRDQFGHAVISNVGTLGLKQGYAPLCPPLRATMMICFGKVEPRAGVAKDGKTIEI
jgi:hypothetical protein